MAGSATRGGGVGLAVIKLNSLPLLTCFYLTKNMLVRYPKQLRQVCKAEPLRQGFAEGHVATSKNSVNFRNGVATFLNRRFLRAAGSASD